MAGMGEGGGEGESKPLPPHLLITGPIAKVPIGPLPPGGGGFAPWSNTKYSTG